MKQTLFTFMFIISLVLMTACGGSPVDKALAKLDDAMKERKTYEKLKEIFYI